MKNFEDSDSDSDDDSEDENLSSQGSTTFHTKSLFKNDHIGPWLKASKGKKNGRILGFRVGNDSMLSNKRRKKMSNEETEKHNTEEFELAVSKAVEKRMEAFEIEN